MSSLSSQAGQITQQNLNGVTGAAATQDAVLNSEFLASLAPKEIKNRELFFCPRQIPVVVDGKIQYKVSASGIPTGIDENETETVELDPAQSHALQELLARFGSLPLETTLAKDKQSKHWVVQQIIPPEKRDLDISLDGPKGKGAHEADLTRVVGPLGHHLSYVCEHNVAHRLSDIFSYSANATQAILSQPLPGGITAKQYLASKAENPNKATNTAEAETPVSSLKEILTGVTAAELEAFYEERTQGKTIKQLLSGELPADVNLTVGNHRITKLVSNLLRNPGEVHPEITTAAKGNKRLAMAIAFNHTIARAVAEYTIAGGLERTVEGIKILSDAELAITPLTYKGEAGYPKGSNVFPIPSSYSDSGQCLPKDALPFLFGKGKLNAITRDHSERAAFALVNQTQLLLGAEGVLLNSNPAAILNKELLATEDGQKSLQKQGLCDGIQAQMLNSSTSSEQTQELLTVEGYLAARDTELESVISTDDDVIAARDKAGLYSSAGAVKKAMTKVMTKAGLGVGEDNTKYIMILATGAAMAAKRLEEFGNTLEGNSVGFF